VNPGSENMSATAAPDCQVGWDLATLERFATDYQYKEADLPIGFSSEPYTRIVLCRDESLEIVLICFAAGQTSSVHDHRGSNCVIRVLRGKILEMLFEKGESSTLAYLMHHCLSPGDVSGLDGEQIHQLSNVDNSGSVLLNFYSPPFQV
jgi:predicted metal-dependent enzyme (double-stranded beta helix superfamily)